jgi:hypothetical protein
MVNTALILLKIISFVGYDIRAIDREIWGHNVVLYYINIFFFNNRNLKSTNCLVETNGQIKLSDIYILPMKPYLDQIIDENEEDDDNIIDKDDQ